MNNHRTLPKFQQMQYLFAAHIRDPNGVPYDANETIFNAKPIEARRLKAYEELFFNNVHSFFSNLFPVLKECFGEDRWAEIVREYMQKHRARTPLFHELGQEFLLFLQDEFESKASDPIFYYELGHYEWVELELAIEQSETSLYKGSLQLSTQVRLAATAMPLYYEWPVNQISADSMPTEKPISPTCLFVFRKPDYGVEFMEISAGLFFLLSGFLDNQSKTVSEIVEEVAKDTGQDHEALQLFALDILNKLADKGVFVELVAEEPIK